MAYNSGNPNGQATSANSTPVVLASDQSALAVKENYTSVAFSTTTSQSQGTFDAVGNGYRYVSVHVVTQGTSSNVTFQSSADNINWVNNTLMASTATITTGATSTTQAGVIYAGTIYGRYFRIVISAITAGTTAGTIVYSTVPIMSVSQGVSATLNASTNLIGMVGLSASTSSAGLTVFYSSSLGNTVTAVKTTPARMHEYDFYNPNSTGVWVQLFNLAVASVTLGTTSPTRAIYIPATSGRDWSSPYSITWATAMAIACTTTAGGSTAPSSPIQAYVGYI